MASARPSAALFLMAAGALAAALALLLGVSRTPALAAAPGAAAAPRRSPLQAAWAQSPSLFVGEDHEECAISAQLAAEIGELRPRPAVLFMEFFHRTPPATRPELVAMYLNTTHGYPCAEQHAALVLRARELGVKVVGLYTEQITVANLGPVEYLLARMGGYYDQYARSVAVAETPAAGAPPLLLSLLGTLHYGNQRALWQACAFSGTPMYATALPGVTYNATCAGTPDDAPCGWAPLRGAAQQGECSDTNRASALGEWALGCAAYASCCPGPGAPPRAMADCPLPRRPLANRGDVGSTTDNVSIARS